MAQGSGNLELSMRITADLRSAVSQLLALQKQIDGVDDAAKSAAVSNTELAKAVDKQSDAAARSAANDAKARALLAEHDQANRQLLASTTELTEADIARTAATDTARASNAAYAASLMNVKGTQEKAAVEAAAALQLFARIDPVGSKLGQIDAYEAELGRLHKAGAVSNSDLLTFGALLEANRSKLLGAGEDAEKAAGGMSKLGLNTSFAQLELARIGKDLSTGQFSLAERSALTLGTRMGLLSALFTATGAAIAATALSVIGLSVAYYKGYEQEQELNKALLLSGNYAGVTRGQMDSLANAVGSASGRFGDAYEATSKLVASGKITGDVLDNATKSAVNYAQLTGESIDKAVATMVKIGEDPVRAVKELDSSLHFLTGTQYDQIKAMEKSGDDAGATALAFDLLKNKTDELIAETKKQEGTLETLFDRWTKGLGIIKQRLLDIGKSTTLQDQLKDAKDQLKQEEISANHFNLSGGVDYFGIDHAKGASDALAKVLDIQKQINAENNKANAQGQAAQIDENYKKASDDLDRLSVSIDKNAAKQAELNKLHKDYEAIQARDPNDPRLTNGSLETFEADIEKKYEEKKPKGMGIDRAELSTDVQAFQQAWADAEKAFTNAERVLEADRKADAIDDQAYFQAKQDDINKLAAAQIAALELEKAGVATHGKTAAERIRIDQQVKDIDARINQAQQDAAAKTDALKEQIAENEKKRAEQYSQLQQQYYTAIGDTGTAQLIRVAAEFKKTAAEMLVAGNVDGQLLAQKLFNVDAAKARLQGIMQEVDLVFGQLDLLSQQSNADQQAGLLTDLQAKQRVIDDNLALAAQLKTKAEQALVQAIASGDQQAVLQAEQLVEKVRELSLVTSAFGQEVQTTLSGDFSQFLQNVATHAESLRQAFGDLFKSIGQGLAKIASDEISQALFAKLHSLFQPGGGTAAAGSAQLASAAAAATASGTTIELGATTLEGAAATLGISADSLLIAAQALAAANAAGGSGGGAGGDSGIAGLIGQAASLVGDGGYATGGAVIGPGTETSDSVFARLSRGEWVHNAASVKHYGTGFMAAVNDRRFPRFAEGGFVGLHAPTTAQLSRGSVAGHQAGPKSLRVVPVFDPSQIAAATAGRAGEQVFVMHFKNNLPSLRAMIGAR